MVLDWNLAETWAAQYRWKVRTNNHPSVANGTQLGYGRVFAELFYMPHDPSQLDFYIQRVSAILGNTPLTPGKSALVVGCGFGYLIEVLIDLGGNQIWGTDTSTWIHSNKANNAYGTTPEMRLDVQSVVANINILDVDAADQFKTFGVPGTGKFNWIITEQVISGFATDNDINAFLAACDVLQTGQGGIVHLVTPGANPTDYNSKSLAAWATYNTSHYWIDIATFDSLGGA